MSFTSDEGFYDKRNWFIWSIELMGVTLGCTSSSAACWEHAEAKSFSIVFTARQLIIGRK